MEKRELMENIGENVRSIRNERKITQEQLADMVDKNASSITRIEAGYRMMSVESLVAVANALGVSCDALIHGKDGTVSMENIIHLLQGQPRETVESVERIIRVCLKEFASDEKGK